LADILDTSGAAAWLPEEWMAKLASSVEMMTEASPGLTLVRDQATVSGVPEALWYSISLSFTADAAIFVGAVEDTWTHIGKSALLAAGVTEVGPNDTRGAYLEILTQASSGLAQSIAGRLEKPVLSLPAREIKLGEDGLDGALGVSLIEITIGEPPPRKLYLGWSRALGTALVQSKSPSREPAESVNVEKRLVLPEKSRTLDLLMEVELPVSVSFGRAQLPLREVLKLNSGSIVELNRTISDPVQRPGGDNRQQLRDRPRRSSSGGGELWRSYPPGDQPRRAAAHFEVENGPQMPPRLRLGL
jgi:flagellar motor switch protein FliN/FliY